MTIELNSVMPLTFIYVIRHSKHSPHPAHKIIPPRGCQHLNLRKEWKNFLVHQNLHGIVSE